MSRHRPIVALLVCACASVPSGLEPARAADPLLPNLREDIPRDSFVIRREHGQHAHWSLGFDAVIVNAGVGALRLDAYRTSDGMVADQLVRMDDGSLLRRPGVARLHYQRGGGHEHWHVSDVVDYSVTELTTGRVRRIIKAGFCLRDRRAFADVPPEVPRTYTPVYRTACGRSRPHIAAFTEGISPGWVDVYEAYLHGQALSLTGVHSGVYVLTQRVNPEGVFLESDMSDNATSLLFRLVRPRRGAPRARALRYCPGQDACPPIP